MGNCHICGKAALLLLILCALCAPPICQGATNASTSRKAPAAARIEARAGQTIKTEFFSVTIPPGWIMPEPINKRSSGLSTAFANEKTGIAVTVNAFNLPIAAKELAERTVESMRKGGLTPSKPVLEKNGLYKVNIAGKANGEAWFGSNGKICAATVILGQKMDMKVANEFLRVFKPNEPRLFPDAMR